MKGKRRKKIKNFVQVPKGLIAKFGRDKALVWAEINNYANMGLGKCVQTMDAMNKELGMDKDYFRDLVNGLVDEGYFYRQRRIGSSSEFTPTSKGVDEANKWEPERKTDLQAPPLERGTQEDDVPTNPTGLPVDPYRSKRQQKEDLIDLPSSLTPEKTGDTEEGEIAIPPPDDQGLAPADDKGFNGKFPDDFNPDDWALNLDQEITGWCGVHKQPLIDGDFCDYCEADDIVTTVNPGPAGWSTADEAI